VVVDGRGLQFLLHRTEAGEQKRLGEFEMKSQTANSLSRRRFIEYLSGSPLYLPMAMSAFASAGRASSSAAFLQSPRDATAPTQSSIPSATDALNVFDFMPVAQQKIAPQHWAYLMTGCDDNLTVQANRDGFQLFQIRARRFVDIENVDTSVRVFGQQYPSPFMLAPIGSQRAFHGDGELATARAARAFGAQMILSTMASHHVRDVAKECQRPLWFQLYPTNDWEVTQRLIQVAEQSDCPVLVLSADNPTRSNRETQKREGDREQVRCQTCHQPGFQGFLREHAVFRGLDVSRVRSHLYPITWSLIDRIRRVTRMKVVIKGIVTAEDAELCVRNGIDGIVVSNHGGRQEESSLSTIEVLPEVVKAVNGKIPVLVDSGFRRGTDAFKALALGATAVGIGRPYIWGLGAFGQPGVEHVLQLLQTELVLTMKMAGCTAIPRITPDFVRRRGH